MSIFIKLFTLSLFLNFIVCILFVLFGQITVRKLRKNPETKDALGFEFLSGWDIINTAEALALPKNWMKKLENGAFSGLYAKANLLHQHTTKFDRFLGRLFFWMLIFSVLSLVVLGLLKEFGVFGT